jgi:acyl carrier protein
VTKDDIRKAVLEALQSVAPEIDPNTVEPGLPIREQFDIDSVDLLNFLVDLENRLGVTVPEQYYGQIATIDHCVAYLARYLSAGAGSASPGPGSPG